MYEVAEEEVTVAQMILHLKTLFRQAGPEEPVHIMRVFEEQRTRRAMIALFLAVLEMVKLQAVVVAQDKLFGDIVLRRHESFETVFASDQPVSAIEKDYR